MYFVVLESKTSTFFERLARIPISSFRSPSSPSHLSSQNFSNDNKRRCPVCLQTFVKRRQWRTWQTHDETKRLDERVPSKTKLWFSVHNLAAARTRWHPSSLCASVCSVSARIWAPHSPNTLKSCPSPLQALSVAGLGAGLTEAVVVNPFEVVKVSLQANRDSFKEVDRNKIPFWLITCW